MRRLNTIAFILTLGGFYSMSHATMKFCLNEKSPATEVIMIENIGTKTSLKAMDKMFDRNDLRVFDQNDSDQKHLIITNLDQSQCLFLNMDEKTSLQVNGNKDFYIPFVIIDEARLTAKYGLIHHLMLNHGTLTPLTKKISTKNILDYDVDKNATVIYVICDAQRSELCKLRIKHKGVWLKIDDKEFSMDVLARSRRERGDQNISQRLLKEGDSPQGVYRIWGSLFTSDGKFGKSPRLDIDGMQPPINFADVSSKDLSRVLPKEAFLDYWSHEFPMAYAFGRHLFRIHDNSVDPKYPNTYTTPHTKQTFRASAGCVNTGDQIHKLLEVLQKTKTLSKKQISNKHHYGQAPAKNKNDTFLVIIDED